MESQLKKGVLELCLLQMIREEETYGYHLLQKMTALFPDQQERTVYAILKRLLQNGHTETFSRGESSGPPRKYYRMTPAGLEYLAALTADWHTLLQAAKLLGLE